MACNGDSGANYLQAGDFLWLGVGRTGRWLGHQAPVCHPSRSGMQMKQNQSHLLSSRGPGPGRWGSLGSGFPSSHPLGLPRILICQVRGDHKGVKVTDWKRQHTPVISDVGGKAGPGEAKLSVATSAPSPLLAGWPLSPLGRLRGPVEASGQGEVLAAGAGSAAS